MGYRSMRNSTSDLMTLRVILILMCYTFLERLYTFSEAKEKVCPVVEPTLQCCGSYLKLQMFDKKRVFGVGMICSASCKVILPL
jgi:hypothetical protein